MDIRPSTPYNARSGNSSLSEHFFHLPFAAIGSAADIPIPAGHPFRRIAGLCRNSGGLSEQVTS